MTAQAVTRSNWAHDISPAQRTCAWRLFHISHPCSVQQIFTMNVGLLERSGSPTTGDEKRDREMRQEWVSVQLTAVQMTELVERGASLMFYNHEVATKIYLDLVGHLKGWLQAFQTNLTLRRAPLEDLMKFDELAAMIFPYASPILIPNEDDAGYGAFLSQRSRRALGGVSMARAARKHTEEGFVMQYDSLSDRIAACMAQRAKEYRT